MVVMMARPITLESPLGVFVGNWLLLYWHQYLQEVKNKICGQNIFLPTNIILGMKNYFNYFLVFQDKSPVFKIKLENLFYSIFYTFFIIFLFLFVSVFVFYSINYFFNTNYDIFNIYSQSKKDLISPVYIVVLLGPVVEEILFRLWLSFNKYEFSLSILFWLFFLFNGTFVELRISLLEGVFFILLSGFLFWGINYLFKQNTFKWTNYKYHFYLISLILFSTLHLFNLDISSKYFWIILPIYIFPKFIIGLFITKLRINYGFYWGVIFHIIINGISYVF